MMRLGLVMSLVFSAGAVAAQDVYVGAGLDYQLPHSGDAQASAALIAGATFGDGLLSYGIEAEYGTALSSGTTYDASRLRARAAYDFGPVTGVAAAGVTRFSEGSTDYSGANFGLGAELPYGDNLTLRLELIRDIMDDYPTDVTTTRAGVVFNF